MEQKETIENNCLIAGFMGAIEQNQIRPGRMYFKGLDDKFPDNMYGCNNEKLQYHTDWSWLMPVVEKIHDECKLYSGGLKFFEGLTIFSNMEQAYEAVIEFITWYNTQSSQ